jgi:undecaprenyl pyrophosphate phosphatase UppP
VRYLHILTAALLVAGCAQFKALRPGEARSATSATNFTATLKQPENPAQASKQDFKETTRSITVIPQPAPLPPITNIVETVRSTETEIGAAQKDTGREIAAKLSSMKFLPVIGAIVFLFGLGTAFYPPLKLLVGGSVTTSGAIIAGGIALIALPMLVVGNELLILGGVGVGITLWFLAHRHGNVRGQLTAVTAEKK